MNHNASLFCCWEAKRPKNSISRISITRPDSGLLDAYFILYSFLFVGSVDGARKHDSLSALCSYSSNSQVFMNMTARLRQCASSIDNMMILKIQKQKDRTFFSLFCHGLL